MSRTVIVGAGALGREIRNYLELSGERNRIVFLDDTQPRHHTLPILGKIDEANFLCNESDRIFLAIADPRGREAVWDKLRDVGVNSYVHGTAIGLPQSLAGGMTMLPWTLISTHVEVGEGLLMHIHSSIGHDCKIGDFVTICGGATLLGRVTIGDRVFIGTDATISPDVTVGDDAFICVGSVVVRDVPPGAKVFGNPAKVIG